MSPKARLPFLVRAAGWYLERDDSAGVEDIALRIHTSLVSAGGSFEFSLEDSKAVAAITTRLLDTDKYDTAVRFLGLSEARSAAAPLLSALEELPADTSPNVLAYFVTSATRSIGRSESIADRIASLQRAAHLFERISQPEMAAGLYQQALQLVLAIDDAQSRTDELLSMARYEASVGQTTAAHAMFSMAIDAARGIRPQTYAHHLKELVQTALELREIDLLRALLRTQSAALDGISPLADQIGGKLRIAGAQAKAGMAADARDTLMEGARLARQLSEPAGMGTTDQVFLALAVAHAGDGVGALDALEIANGTVLGDANTIAEVAAEIAIDSCLAGKPVLARRALDRAASALSAAAATVQLEPTLEVSFAHGLTGDAQAAADGLRQATHIALAMEQPVDRVSALLRVAQFAAAVERSRYEPRQIGLEGWKILGL
jgi:hypothetical protein